MQTIEPPTVGNTVVLAREVQLGQEAWLDDEWAAVETITRGWTATTLWVRWSDGVLTDLRLPHATRVLVRGELSRLIEADVWPRTETATVHRNFSSVAGLGTYARA